MESILYPLLAALSVMLISLVGVLFTVGEIGRWLQRHLTYLATFAGGVFLLVAWHLAEEAVHEGGWVIGLGAVLVGAILMESINFFFPAHHHHGKAQDHGHSHIDGRRVLLSDALHNVGDGILLVAAFAADFYVGIAATVGVLLHEFVQEISEYFVLRESGYSNSRALSLNFAVSASILVGLFLAIFLSSSELLVSVLAGVAAGGFLSVLLHDLLPHALASVKTHGRAYIHVAMLLAGAGLMFAVQTSIGHEEAEDTGAAASEATPDYETKPTAPQTRDTDALTGSRTSAEIQPQSESTGGDESLAGDEMAPSSADGSSTTSPQIPGTRN